MACDGYFHVLEEDDAAIPGLFDIIEHKDGDSFTIAARKLSAIARKEDLQRIRKTYGHVYGPMRKEMEKVLESVILRNPELERNRDLYFSLPITPDEKAFGRFAENAENYLDVRYRNSILPKRIISESVAANVSSALKKIEIRLYNEADNLQYYGEDKAGTFDRLLELLAWASSDLSGKTLSRDGRAGVPTYTYYTLRGITPSIRGRCSWLTADSGTEKDLRKCSMPHARTAAKNAKYLSDPLRENPFTAGNASESTVLPK